MPGLLISTRSTPFNIYRTFGGVSQVVGGNMTVTLPPGDTGQLLLYSAAFRGAPTFTAPAGWTIAQQVSYADTSNGGDCGSLIAYKIRQPGEPTAVFTRTGGSTTAGGFMTGYTPNKSGTWQFDTSASNSLLSPSTVATGTAMTISGINNLLYAVISVSRFDPILLTDFQGAGIGPLGSTYLVNGAGENVSMTAWGQCFYSGFGFPNPEATSLGFDVFGPSAGSTGAFTASLTYSTYATMQTMAFSYLY